jgi:hypothetical protein
MLSHVSFFVHVHPADAAVALVALAVALTVQWFRFRAGRKGDDAL